MPHTRVAKLFKNGSSQAVRLPADFRFEGEEIYATRNETTGDVVLSSKPGVHAWREFFEMVHAIPDTEEFMTDRPLNVPPQKPDPFEHER